MEEKSEFDILIPRAGTGAVKYDARYAVFGSADLLPLWVADMDFPAPECVRRALAERAAHPIYGYGIRPPAMYDALIDWTARRHGWRMEKSWIRFTPGVVPAIFAAVRAFTEPGDGVVVQTPVYYPFFSAVTHNGRTLVENPLVVRDGRYRMDLAGLEACLSTRTKLLLLCSPHNPGGRVWTKNELSDLLTLCASRGITVVSDEIHCDLVFPGYRHLPTAALADAGGVVTFLAPSKTFNTAGLATAAVVIPDAGMRARFGHVMEELHIAEGNVFGDVALIAAYREGGPWLGRLMDYLQANLDFLETFVAEHLPGIELMRPEATYLAWLDCRGLGLDDDALRRFFIHDARLGLNPGVQFGIPGSGYMRLNFAVPRGLLAEALGRLARALAARGRQPRLR